MLFRSPSNLSVSNITRTGATLSWTGTGDSYNIHYKASGDAVWTLINDVVSPYNLTGLTDITDYEIEVQSVCGENLSSWATATVDPVYSASITDVDYGTASWCEGETRNVRFTVENTGNVVWCANANASSDNCTSILHQVAIVGKFDYQSSFGKILAIARSAAICSAFFTVYSSPSATTLSSIRSCTR